MAQLTWVYEDERLVLARARSLCLAGWRDAPLADHIRRWHELGRSIARTHRGAGACIDVIYGGTPRFSDEMRREAERFSADNAIFEIGFAHVILVPGMVGSAVRAFVSTIVLVGRSGSPTKVTGDLAGAVAWMAPRLAPHGWTAAELSTACDELSARATAGSRERAP